MNKRILTFFTLLLGLNFSSFAQLKDAAEILHDLERLKSPYRCLYLAAHPDDENTRLIAYLTGEEKARTAYLSLTRGDGGQNLIGPEKGALLGVLRTEELMAARRIDLGEQYFTHAVDFGYSKTKNETLNFWGKDLILSDVVFVIKDFKPHIVINRFPTDNYSGHGHHQASAALSAEAFEIVSQDENNPWNIGSLYLNSSTWWDKTLEERAKNDSRITTVDIGTFNSLLGYSYNEISAFSRSQHKSQGFGSTPSRGSQLEYLELLKGIQPQGSIFHEGLLDEIDKKWLALGTKIDAIIENYNPTKPAESVSELLSLRSEVSSLAANHPRFHSKLKLLNKLIINCMGLSVSLSTNQLELTRNETYTVNVEIVNRNDYEVFLNEISFNKEIHSWNRVLDNNIVFKDTFQSTVEADAFYSNPYWLNNEFENTYRHSQKDLLIPDYTNGQLKAEVSLSINNQPFTFTQPLYYHWNDRVKGGLKRPTMIVPKASVSFDAGTYFPNQNVVSGTISLKTNSEGLKGKVVLVCDTQLRVEMTSVVHFGPGDRIKSIPFKIKLDSSQKIDPNMSLMFISDKDTFRNEVFEIEYDHIRTQRAILPAAAKIVAVACPKEVGRVAYVSGPDNQMVDFLRLCGCDVDEIGTSEILSGKLQNYNTLLFGIRSVNVNKNLQMHGQTIKEFTKKGGTVVLQYQTNRGINPIQFSPYEFEISRKRVTDENANAKFLKPLHPILNQPFDLLKEDFEGWNQERGLYFAENWGEGFETIISWHDPEELDEFGGLIVGDYGKGAFIYTGISFFRHIPAGVPGSYKLLFNILSYKP